MCFLLGQAEVICHPTIGVLPTHDSGLPQTIEFPMRTDPEVSKITVGQYTHRCLCARVDSYIRLAARIVPTYIEFILSTLVLIDLRGWTDNCNRTAVGTSHNTLLILLCLFLSHENYLFFCLLAISTHWKGRGTPHLHL